MRLSTALSAWDHGKILRTADILAVLLAIAIPWSTSAAAILSALYVIAILPLLNAESVSIGRKEPALWLPVALVGLGVIGILWADVSWSEYWIGLKPLFKLLALPLVMLHFRLSERTELVFYGFLGSCTVLLAVSTIPEFVPPLRGVWRIDHGVPVKNRIIQSGEFLICIFAALYLAYDRAKTGYRSAAAALLILATIFALNQIFIRTSRTTLATAPVLLLLFGYWLFRWKGVAAAILFGALVAAAAWVSSPYFRSEATSVPSEIEYNQATKKPTPSAERLEYWKKSLRFIARAPVLGHGTGSIEGLFRESSEGKTGVAAYVTRNPHNQTFMIGIQFGAVGIIVLWAMWIVHVLSLRRNGFVAWFGLVVAVQVIVGSLFNSLLSDVTQSWYYIVLVGAAIGETLKLRYPATATARAIGQ